jgi:hypothetical protein
MRCGIFTRGDRPLRWRTLCEVCRRPVGVPFYFWTAPVSQQQNPRARTRYRCDGCKHQPGAVQS